MFEKHISSAIHHGRLQESDLDRAAARILELKFKLGLFDRPFADPEQAERTIGKPEHRELARRIAGESIVMLKNEGGTLPLSKVIGKLAVIGPNADASYNQLGDYTSPQPKGAIVTVLDGIRNALDGGLDRVLYAPGCRIKGDSGKASRMRWPVQPRRMLL